MTTVLERGPELVRPARRKAWPLAAVLAAAVPPKLREAAVGIWGGISGLGIAVGPVVGGAVADGLDWHWIFWLNVPVGLIAIPLVAVVLIECRGGASRMVLLGLVLS